MSGLSYSLAFQSLVGHEHLLHVPVQKETQLADQRLVDTIASKQLQKTYFTKFRSLAEDQTDFRYESNNKPVVLKDIDIQSRINGIITVVEPTVVLRSAIGTVQGDFRLIKTPALYSFKEAAQSQRENINSINRELGEKHRSYFKGQVIKEDSEELLDLRQLSFQDYSYCISQKYSNQLFQSILKTFGGMDIDQQVQTPDRFEVREKKVKHTIATHTEEQGLTQPLRPELTKTALMRTNIQAYKARNQRRSPYFEQMEDKLVDLFNHILESDVSVNRLPLLDKIKFVLSDLDKYKHQMCDGESKVSLLLFFFKEFQTLKEEKAKADRSVLRENQQETKRNSATPAKPRSLLKIRPQSQKPTRPKDTSRESEWIGSL